jgi:methionyl-tRNA formyltransferase
MRALKIVFMGTPEFAVPSLQILVNHQLQVVAVITAPDKPHGRGQKLVPSPVKEFAMANSIPVLQPANLKSPQFLEELRNHKADLQIVVAFRMLPEVVWSMPVLGTFNLHASLLPQYRGAAPINWAIINGESETGVTTFFLKHQIDTGTIIFQEKEEIGKDDDAGALHERLKKKGSQLVLKTVKAIESGNAPSQPQPETADLHHAPKIFKETCEIRWTQSAARVRDLVRGLSPYPAAWTILNQKNFKIFKVSIPSFQKESDPGNFSSDGKNYLYIKAADQWISVDELQPEGKRKMTIREFFMGNKI